MSTEVTVIEQVRSTLSNMGTQFKMALPTHITPEKFIRTVMTAIQNNKSILDADRTSLYSAAMRSASDGLLPNGSESALVKFGNQVAYMPMVSGILKKIRNSGELSSITAQVVYEKDKFKYYVDGEGEHLSHEPNIFGDRGAVLGVYALAKTKDGAVYVEVITEEQIQKVRNVSRSKNAGPWVEWPDEMRKKTAIRRLAKRLPMSSDVETTIHADDELYESKSVAETTPAIMPESEQIPEKKQTSTPRLSKIVEAKSNPEGPL